MAENVLYVSNNQETIEKLTLVEDEEEDEEEEDRMGGGFSSSTNRRRSYLSFMNCSRALWRYCEARN